MQFEKVISLFHFFFNNISDLNNKIWIGWHYVDFYGH